MVLPVGFFAARSLVETGGGGWIWNGTFDTNTNSCALMGTTIDGYLYLMGTDDNEVSLYGFDLSDGSVVFNSGMSYALYDFWQSSASSNQGAASNNRQLAGYKVSDTNHRIMFAGQYRTNTSYATQNSPHRLAAIHLDHNPTTHSVSIGANVHEASSYNATNNYGQLRPAISQIGDGGRYCWIGAHIRNVDYSDGYWAQLPIFLYDMNQATLTYKAGRLVDKYNTNNLNAVYPRDVLTYSSASGNTTSIGLISENLIAERSYTGTGITSYTQMRIGPYSANPRYQSRWFVKTGGATDPVYVTYAYVNPQIQKFDQYNYLPNANEQSDSVWRITGYGSGANAYLLCMKRNTAEDRIYILLGNNQDNDLTVVELDMDLAKQNEWSISCSSTSYWTPANLSANPMRSMVNMEVVTEEGTDFLVIYHKKDSSNAGTIMKLPADGSAAGTYGDYTIGTNSSSHVNTNYSVVTAPDYSYLGTNRMQRSSYYLSGFVSNAVDQFNNANPTGTSSVYAAGASANSSYGQYSQNLLQSI